MNPNKLSLTQENQESDRELKPKHATRTVLFDQDNKVAIINVRNHGYYKIPGGGIEADENIIDAARREVQEESGCNCKIIGQLDQLETEIPAWNMLDISDGFIAVVEGQKSQPSYEAWEAERGFAIEWFDDLNSAIATIEKNIVHDPSMNAMQTRDLAFLKLAREKINGNS